MLRNIIESAVYDKACSDMEIRIFYTDKEIWEEIKNAKTVDLLEYLKDD